MICPRYFCNNTLAEYDCISQFYTHLHNSSFIHFNLKTCPYSYNCDISPLETNEYPATCKKNSPLSNIIIQYSKIKAQNIKKLPGAFCNDNFDCLSDNCDQNKCVGLPPYSPCESHADCNISLKCDPYRKYCNHQIYVNEEGCLEDFDCINNAGCINGTCIAYQSLEDGIKSPSDYFCKSGHRYRGICLGGIKIYNKRLPYPCNINEVENEKCEYFDGNNKFYINCDCGINSEGQGYCPLGKGDTEYKIFMKSVTDVRFHSSKCHTLARNDNNHCNEKSLDEAYKLSKIRSFIYHKHQLIQKNDQCAKNTILHDFYKLATSVWLKINILVVFLILFIVV